MREISSLISDVSIGLSFISIYLLLIKYKTAKKRYILYFLISFLTSTANMLLMKLPMIFPEFLAQMDENIFAAMAVFPLVGLYYFYKTVKELTPGLIGVWLKAAIHAIFILLLFLSIAEFFITVPAQAISWTSIAFNYTARAFQMLAASLTFLYLSKPLTGRARAAIGFGGFYLALVFLALLNYWLSEINVISNDLLNLIFVSLKTVATAAPILFLNKFVDLTEGKPDAQEGNPELDEKLLEEFSISKREAEVIRLICKGKSNHDIGEELFISVATVKDHVYKIFKKTDVKNRVQLSNIFRLTNS